MKLEHRCPQCGTVHPLLEPLEAKLEAERKAREASERKLLATEESSANQYQRAERAEAALANVFEETRERCAKVCEAVAKDIGAFNSISASVASECEYAIRALSTPANRTVLTEGEVIRAQEEDIENFARAIPPAAALPLETPSIVTADNFTIAASTIHPTNMMFFVGQDNKQVGTLRLSDPMTFEGNADESAELFLKHVCQKYNKRERDLTRLRTALKWCYEKLQPLQPFEDWVREIAGG